MDNYDALTSVLEEITSFTGLDVYLLVVYSVAGHILLKICVKTQCHLQNTLIAT